MIDYKPRVKTTQNGPVVDAGAEEYDPRLYEPATTVTPVGGLDAVVEEHIEFYRQEGYLAVGNVFDEDEVRDAKEGLLDLILGRVPEFQSITFESKAGENLDSLSDEERQDAVRRIAWFVDFEKRLRAMALSSKLEGILMRLLGEEPKLVQDMALIKPPGIGREKPWHQDHAYFNYPVDTPVTGVWIALDTATVANGCMHVQPRGHRPGPIVHFKRRDWQICDTEIMGKPCVAVPLQPGGALFFDSLLPHGTPANGSAQRRKAVQFHYAGKSAQPCGEEQRLAVFGSEGKEVEC